MSNDEFESWLALVGRLLGLSERQRTQISEELRDHLESRIADLIDSGMNRQAAVMKAVEEFGDAAVLAKNLQSVSLTNRKRWMMRFMTMATAAMFLVAVLTMAMWPENARFGSPSQSVAQDGKNDLASASDSPAEANKREGQPSSRSVSDARIRELLSKKVDLVYDSEPFGDVRAGLSNELGMNILIDMNLEGVIDKDTEVSVNLNDVVLSDGLRLMLRGLDATYTIKNGALLIISVDDEQEPGYISRHMIDVNTLLRLIKRSEADRIGKPVAMVRANRGGGGGSFGGGGGGGGGGGVFRIASQLEELPGAKSENDPVRKVEQAPVATPLLTAEGLLIETVTRVVSPDSWTINGGGCCDLTCIGGVLVVLSDESLAEEVDDFVTDLEYKMNKSSE